MTAPPWKQLNPFLLMEKQYCVCHLLTGYSYFSYCVLGDSFFSILTETHDIGIVLHFCLRNFYFLIFPLKKSKWLNPRPPQCLSFAQIDLLCMHRPSVQFLDCRTRPSQSLPPFLGAGAVHSLLRQCVHSVPQVDHLLHEVHLPSTATQKPASGQREKELFEGREEQSTSRNKTTPNTEENAPRPPLPRRGTLHSF